MVPMFDKLTERLAGAVDSLRGRGRLTEDNIADTLRQVRMALLEADVALPVVKAFIDAVLKAKPSGAKGHYMKKISISSTMGPGVKIALSAVGAGGAA